jgi:hypothetical protein
VIQIDLHADLNVEDDDGRNIAMITDAVDPSLVVAGGVLIAGTPSFWSWVRIDAIENELIYVHQISAKEAARHGPLVAPLPRPA